MHEVIHRKILSRIKQKAMRVIHKIQGKQRVHFLHIGKTGGSAFKHALNKHSANNRYIIYLHPHDVKLRNIPEGESVIFFLRDPINRFVSGFFSRQRQGQPMHFSPWNSDEKNAFEYFDTPNQLAIALSSTDAEEKTRSQKAMKSIQHVRNSYWEWFESEEYLKSRLSDIFFIGFQEHLTEDFEILKSKLGLSESVELPNDNIQAHRNPTNLDKTLKYKAIENLKHWYKDDYKFISLCKEIIECQGFGSSIGATCTDNK